MRRWLGGAAAAAAGALVLAMTAPSASAAELYEPIWTPVSGEVDSTTTPVLLRGGTTISGYRLFWVQRDGDGTWSVRGRAVNPGGVGAATTVTSGWASLNTRLGGHNLGCAPGFTQRLLFAGNQTTNPADPMSQGVLYGADSGDGATWTLNTSGSYSFTRQAVSTYGLAGTEASGLACGLTLAAFTSGSSTHVSYRVGPEGTIPAGTPDPATADTGSGVRAVNVVRTSSETWVVWSSFGTNATEAGIHAQRVLPSAGPVLHAPGSARADGFAPLDDQPVAAAARPNDQVWVAYQDASNQRLVRFWQVGSAGTSSVAVRNPIQHVALTSTPSGRLFAAVAQAAVTTPNPTITAIRSLPGSGCSTSSVVTSSIEVPKARGVYTNVWQMGAAPRPTGGAAVTSAYRESMQLWANASTGASDRLWYRQVQPRLQVAVVTSPKVITSAKGGKVVVVARDTCKPVPGVTATLSLPGGKKVVATTTKSGVAILSVPKGTRAGRYLFVVAKAGYVGQVTYLRVR